MRPATARNSPAGEREEIAIIRDFMPKQMNEDGSQGRRCQA